MFDIGFWELILIAIISLVILGPERLPVAIRTVRSWLAGIRKFSDTVKTELTEELRVHELHTNLKKAEQSNLQNLSPEVSESLKTLQEAAASVSEPFKKLETESMDSLNAASSTSSPGTKHENEQFDKVDVNSDTDTTEDLAQKIVSTVDKKNIKSQS
ncbi:Sec-independent protein translocase protein TatB [Colwelliaceae bacterium MEBiC 14330]